MLDKMVVKLIKLNGCDFNAETKWGRVQVPSKDHYVSDVVGLNVKMFKD